MLVLINEKYQKLLFGRSKQLAFLEDVSALIKDGVPAPQAIKTVQEINTGSPKYVAKAMLDGIAEGKRISESMEGWFSPTIVEIVRSGEEGGTLVKTMVAAMHSLSLQSSAVTSFLSSSSYPLVVFFMACGVAIFLKHSVFDSFAAIKPVEKWPENGRLLMTAATFLEHWWWLVVFAIGGFIFLIVQILTKVTGDIRYFIDDVPFLSLYRSYSAASFMGTLGLLLMNGVPFKHALNIIQRNATKYVRWHISMMQLLLSGGKENIADVLDTKMIQSEDLMRLKVMAKGKGFPQALLSLGEQALERNTKKLKISGRLFGGMLLAVDMLIVMFMIFSVYGVGSMLAS
jgi:type II secretory pathway component PulF